VKIVLHAASVTPLPSGMWGLINRLAYEDNIRPIVTSKVATVGAVIAYRSLLGGGWVLLELGKDVWNWDFKERYDTTYGRAAWAAFGWDWAKSNLAIEPFENRLPNSPPNQVAWNRGLFWSAGSNPRTFSGQVQ
jgi:hypothetical protein